MKLCPSQYEADKAIQRCIKYRHNLPLLPPLFERKKRENQMPASAKEMAVIEWTAEKRERLRAAHKLAKAANQSQFTFDGHEFHTGYAGYLLEYLDMKMEKRDEQPKRRRRNG